MMNEQNPYASPAAVDDNLEPQLSREAGELRPIRPRWWEIGLFAVLMSGLLLLAVISLSLDFATNNPALPTLEVVLLFVYAFSLLTTIVGGLVAVRVWIERGFSIETTHLAPGHAILISALLGNAMLFGVWLMAIFVNPGEYPNSLRVQMVFEFLVVAQFSVLLFLIHNHPRWRWVGAGLLTLAVVVFGLWLSRPVDDLLAARDPATTANVRAVASAMAGLWLLGILMTGILALLETRWGPHRDWLHWTGLACWAITIIYNHWYALI